MLAVECTSCGTIPSNVKIGCWICPTSCKKDVITPNVIVPLRNPRPPQIKASKYPSPNAEPIANRATAVKRVRRRTSPSSLLCFKPRRSSTQFSLSSERNTALYSTPSCTCIWMRLSPSRISSVILRKRREISFPTTTSTGVSSNSAHANRASNQRISKNAPTSWIPVTAICGIVSIIEVDTVSISFESLEDTSPECSSWPSKSLRLNSVPK